MRVRPVRPVRLTGVALFAAMISAAGLPIYIHAPKFYVDSYGVSLSALGAVLFGLRLLDVVQDPMLGWLAERLRKGRGIAVAVGVVVLAVSMAGLFAVAPPIAPLLWFALTLVGLFSAFSFLTIMFYAQGIGLGAELGAGGHVRLAGWREAGALIGVCLAAVAPTLLGASAAPFAWFSGGFALLCVVAWLGMRGFWSRPSLPPTGAPDSGFATVLRDRQARRLLILALVNATPAAVSSTLFLFFVESRLDAPGWEGPLLLLFFLSAAGSAPLWSVLARRFGARRVLLVAMAAAVMIFGCALFLAAGDVVPFALVCIGSGAVMGADLTLLPALFSRRLAVISPSGGAAFGLWAMVTKASLALAAVGLLPLLELRGFAPGAENAASVLRDLTLLYAGLPCVLKLVAIALLSTLKLEET